MRDEVWQAFQNSLKERGDVYRRLANGESAEAKAIARIQNIESTEWETLLAGEPITAEQVEAMNTWIAQKLEKKDTKLFAYKGLLGKADKDEEANIFFGRVLGLRDVITFQSATIEQAEEEFKFSVDEYIRFLKESQEAIAPEQDLIEINGTTLDMNQMGWQGDDFEECLDHVEKHRKG